MALQLEDGPLHLGELVAKLVDQHPFALRHRAEFLLDELHARDQAVFDGLDGDAHVLERGLELALQRLLVDEVALHVGIEDTRHLVVDLEQFMLHSLQAIGVAIVGVHHADPGGPVKVVLAAQVTDELRELNDRHRPVRVLREDGLRHLCTERRAGAGARRSSNR